jgi:hypothetical protein
MSKRHRDEKPLRDPKGVRRLEQRALRHRVDQTLHEADDLEAVVLDVPRAERRGVVPVASRAVRHWKLKSWKRRTAVQAQRNAALDALIRAE